MFNLEGKHAVVTGAGSGIGKAVAILLAKQGATVYVADINEDQAKETAKEIGDNAQAKKADVSNQAQIIALFDSLPFHIILRVIVQAIWRSPQGRSTALREKGLET